MVPALLMLLQAATLPVPDAAVIDDAGTITVTATRLSDLAADAERCAKLGCPTRKDIAVSVAYASALFDDGKYLDAKGILARTVARTKWAAKAEPLALATLYQAQATLSTHEGDQRTTWQATWASRNVLTEGAAVPALARLTAEFRVADLQVRNRDNIGAEARFAAVAAEARATGHGALADVADLRRALILSAMRRNTESRALLETLAARSEPDSGDVRRAALATAARIAFVNQDTDAANAYTARLAQIVAGPQPVLISAPPLPKPAQSGPSDPFTLVNNNNDDRSSDFLGLRWVDIGFWIRPDGSVDDVAILRGSTTSKWAQPLLGYVGARRYSGFAATAEAGRAGQYRIERYTLTADYLTPKGSLIRRRIANPRFEMMEMGAEAPIG
jgi:hypothetical protein